MQRIPTVSLTPFSADEPPRASRILPSNRQPCCSQPRHKAAETDDGAALLFMHGGAWVRWAQMPRGFPPGTTHRTAAQINSAGAALNGADEPHLPRDSHDVNAKGHSDMNTEAVNQEYQTVNLSQLTESLTNPRKTFDHKTLNEMAESIRAVGLLQPILVRPTATEGRFEIVAGARRFRAARLAEIESVCVRVCQLTDAQTLEAQLIENLVRADVHPYEETQGFLALMRLDRPGTRLKSWLRRLENL